MKTLKEYLGVPTIRVGGLDSVHPIASLGDKPPKGKGSRDSRAVGLSADLYSDDNPRDTVKGTGYGDAEAARKSLQIIKSVNKVRQMQIVNTLYNRAKHHANRTKDMEAAMVIFKKWIYQNKKD